MRGTTSVAAILATTLIVVLAWALPPPVVAATVLCRAKRGGLVIRDVCKPKEETLDAPKLDALGLRGPAGPAGPPGPSGGGLKVVDATGVVSVKV